VFIPGIFKASAPIVDVNDERMVLGEDGQPASQIHLQAAGTGILLGGNSANFVALANKVAIELAKLVVAGAAASAAVVAGDGGAAAFAAFNASLAAAGFPTSTASTNTKAEG
jgi:hypothetical protein